MPSTPLSRRTVLLAAPAILVSGCASLPRLPYADHVIVQKQRRKMFLVRGRDTLADYDVDLGFQPLGHKSREGDGRTPEGFYWIDRKNPNSAFHLSLGISYPNGQDIRVAYAAGFEPGGDIFIHGQPNRGGRPEDSPDWTAGCIAVTNREIEQIYNAVLVGTPITIYA